MSEQEEQYIYLVQNCDSENSCAMFHTDREAREWVKSQDESSLGKPFIVQVPTHTSFQLADLQHTSSTARTLRDAFEHVGVAPERCTSFGSESN